MVAVTTLSRAEVARVSDVVRRLANAPSTEVFQAEAASAVFSLLPGHSVVFNEFDASGTPIASRVHGIEMPPWMPEAWARTAHEHPVAAHLLSSSASTPHTLSEFMGPARFHRTALFAQVFEPLGLEDQLVVPLDPGHDGVSGFACNRGLRSFTEVERTTAGLLTVGLSPAFAAVRARQPRAAEPPVDVALTPRQAQVLSELAAGHSYDQIATRLGVSLGTVRTHVERLYRTLGVRTAAEAVHVGMGPWLDH
ncbi:hypothetical protein BH23ACT9_BH23ACT9_02210 [soil metagenome]